MASEKLCLPLDVEHKKELDNIRFYFKAKNAPTLYSLRRGDFDQSEMIKNMPNSAICTQDNPFVFDEIKQDNNIINLPHHIDFVGKYMQIWDGKCAESMYCAAEVVQTNKPEQLLQEVDLLLIQSYIDREKEQLTPQQKTLIESNRLAYNHWRIDILSPLVCTVDGMFAMNGLRNKLYAYIATIIGDCSIREYNEEQSDPYFCELQRDAKAKWRADNVYKHEIIGDLDKTN